MEEELEASLTKQRQAPPLRFSPSPQSEPYLASIRQAEKKYGLPQNLLARVIQQESNFDPQAISSKGARGIAQIMPEHHPDVDPDDPVQAIDYAAGYLRQNADRFGDWRKALAAYNAGPGNVEKHGGVPPFAETQDYIKRIMDDSAPAGADGDSDALLAWMEQELELATTPEPGYAKAAVKGMARGAEHMLGGVGSAIRWLGEVTQSEALARLGDESSNYWHQAVQEGWEAPDPRIFRGTFIENPSLKRAIGIVGEALPSLAVALGISAVTGPAGGAAVLGLLEGAPQYEEAREAGKGVAEASVYGTISTAGTALLEFLPISHMMRGIKGGTLIKGLVGGAEEALQEATQTVFQNLVAKIGYDDTQQLFEGIIESMIGGFGSGAIAAPTVGKLNDVLAKHKDKLTEDDVDAAYDITEENVQAAADAVRKAPPNDRPVEEDIARHEASKAADPLGDDSVAKDIIDKIAAGGRTAPVATTARGQGAEELKAAMGEEAVSEPKPAEGEPQPYELPPKIQGAMRRTDDYAKWFRANQDMSRRSNAAMADELDYFVDRLSLGNLPMRLARVVKSKGKAWGDERMDRVVDLHEPVRRALADQYGMELVFKAFEDPEYKKKIRARHEAEDKLHQQARELLSEDEYRKISMTNVLSHYFDPEKKERPTTYGLARRLKVPVEEVKEAVALVNELTDGGLYIGERGVIDGTLFDADGYDMHRIFKAVVDKRGQTGTKPVKERKPWQWKRHEFSQRGDHMRYIQEGHYLRKAPDMGPKELMALGKVELQGAAGSMGLKISGSKQAIVDRIMINRDLRQKLKGETADSLQKKYNNKQLGEMVFQITGKKRGYLPKRQRAEAIIKGLEDQTRRGQIGVSDAIHHLSVKKAVAAGRPVSDDVLQHYVDQGYDWAKAEWKKRGNAPPKTAGEMIDDQRQWQPQADAETAKRFIASLSDAQRKAQAQLVEAVNEAVAAGKSPYGPLLKLADATGTRKPLSEIATATQTEHRKGFEAQKHEAKGREWARKHVDTFDISRTDKGFEDSPHARQIRAQRMAEKARAKLAGLEERGRRYAPLPGKKIPTRDAQFWEGVKKEAQKIHTAETERTIQAELEKAPEAPTVEQGDRPIVKGKITAAKTPTFEYGVDQINEYSDEGAIAKAQFHKDATAHLRRLGKALGGKSLYPKSKTGVSANTAGIAVAGDIYGKWELPNGKTVEVNLSDTALANKPWTPVTKSGVAMIVNIDKGPNNWLDAKMPVDKLTAKINQLAGVKQAPAPGKGAVPVKSLTKPETVAALTRLRDHLENKGAGWIPSAKNTFERVSYRIVPSEAKDGYYSIERIDERKLRQIHTGPWNMEQARAAAMRMARMELETGEKPPHPSSIEKTTEEKAPVKFEIGDIVRPKQGSGISEKNAGRIEHIQRDIEGNESIKTENTGNMHFAAEGWELVPPAAEAEKPLTPSSQTANNKPLASVSADDLLAEWDRQAAEAEKPKKPETLKERRKRVKARQKKNAQAAKQPAKVKKAARQKAKETKQHLANALDALKQINKIVGEKGQLGEVDPSKWEQIRPLLKLAWDEMLAAGKSAKEFVALSLQTLSPAGRPYFEKFVREEIANEPVSGENEIPSDEGLPRDREEVAGEPRPAGPGDQTDADQFGPVRAGAEEQEPGIRPETGADQQLHRPGGRTGQAKPGRRPVRADDRVGGGKGSSVSPGAQDTEALAPEDRNHVIAPDDVIAPPGIEGKINANIKAVRLLKQLEEQDRNPTPDEKKILAQYVGWGAFSQKVFNADYHRYLTKNKDTAPEDYFWQPETLKKYNQWANKYGKKLHPQLGGLMTQEEWSSAAASTINAHFTSKEVGTKMWDLAKRLGFKGGTVLEPAAGVGNFFGLMPQDIAQESVLFGVEKDSLSGRILTKLYPQAAVEVGPFEKSKAVLDNSIDLTITNVPFGRVSISDKRHPDYDGWRLHNYFLARSLDATKPGGLMMAITSAWSMDAKSNGTVREYLANKADLIGAMRLPNTAFKSNAGTEVVTDVLVFRKKDSNAASLGHDFRVVDYLDNKEFRAAEKKLMQARERFARVKKTKPQKDAKAHVWRGYRNRYKAAKEAVSEAMTEYRASYAINEYFIKNPEMVLGKHSMKGSMYAANTYTVEPSGDLAGQMAEAVTSFPEDIAGEGSDLSQLERVELAGMNAKEGTLTVKDGEIKLIENGRLVSPHYVGSKGEKMPLKPAQLKRVKAYLKLRDLTAETIAAMGDEATTDAQVTDYQRRLNQTYDAYVKKFKAFNGNAANSFLSKLDNDFALVDALEVRVGDGPEAEWVKAPIFTERTVYPFREPDSADSIEDAINLSIIYRGEVSMPYLSELLSIQDTEAIKREIVEKGLGFVNPDTGKVEQRDLYLSGNVKKKLAKAKALAQGDPSYDANVKALEAVIPEDIDIEFITFRLGSTWLPAEAVQDFIKEVIEVDATVEYVEKAGVSRWHIGINSGAFNIKNRETYASGDITAVGLIDLALNLKSPKVMVPTEDGKNTIEDKEKSREARIKMNEVSDEFVAWAKGHADWTPKLTAKYNEEKNGTVLRKHTAPDIDVYPNASPVNVDGAPLRLREHQKIAVSRALQESVLLAYGVGTGKTFILITTAMEMKRIGTARKPLIVAHNSTIDQYRNSFKVLYPGAKVLIPNDKQRNAKQRKKLLISMATNDWDAIVLPQSFFDGIANDPAREQAFVDEQIAQIEDAIAEAVADEGSDSWTVKDLETLKENRIQRLDRLLDRRQDEALTFEQMGIDALLVDEVHSYKRSEFYTKLNKVRGIDNGSSQKSTSLILKSQFVRQKTGGKNIITATGTPISNTLAELWTMLRYVRPDLLDDYGVAMFDNFASTFGVVDEDTEQTASGFKEIERFKSYTNGPELLSMFYSGADVRLTKDANLRLPDIKGDKPTMIVNDKSPELTLYIKDIIDRWKAWELLAGREKRQQKHVPIVLYGLAKKAAVDMRLVDPQYYKDDPNSKVNNCVREAQRIYKETADIKGTQVIFCDLIRDNAKAPRFNLHEDLRAKLVKTGIGDDEVVIFESGLSDTKEEAIKDRVRSGAIRVIIGTTERLGIGVDIADKIVAGHHLTVPDRPMDMEQRNGRFIRQSNKNSQVEVLQYATKDTLDAVMFQRLATKQKGADQVLTGDIDGRDFEDPYSAEQADFNEFAAAASGKAGKLLFEKSKLTSQLHKHRIAEQAHIRKVSNARREINQIPEQIRHAEIDLANAERFKAYTDEAFPTGRLENLTIDGKEMPRKEVYEILTKRIEGQLNAWEDEFIGKPMGDFRKNAPDKDGYGDPRLSAEYKLAAGDIELRVELIGRENYNREKKPSTKLQWLQLRDWNEEWRTAKVGNIPISLRYKGRFLGHIYNVGRNSLAQKITKKLNELIAESKTRPDYHRKAIKAHKADMAEYEKIAQETFKYREEMTEIQRRIAEIKAELTLLSSDELLGLEDETAEQEAPAPSGIAYHTKSPGQIRTQAMKDLKNGIMRLLVDDLNLHRHEIEDWKEHIKEVKDTPKGIVIATRNFMAAYDYELSADARRALGRLMRNATEQINQGQLVGTFGEPLSAGIPKALDETLPDDLPEGVTRFAMGTAVERRAIDAYQVRNVQRAAEVVTSALSMAGVSKELRKQITLDFKPIIDLRGKDIEKTVKEWAAQKKSVSTILGATTFNRFNALVELSIEQDLTSLERTGYHESLHILARWVLPEAEYGRLMKLYKGNEEAAAEGFADYMAGRTKPIGWLRRIFIKLRNLLRRVGSALRGAGFTSAEDIFGKLAARRYPVQQRAAAAGTNIALMAEQRAKKWYSQMERHLEAKLPGRGTPAQIRKLLDTWAQKGQIKAEELEWSGLSEWLDTQSGKLDKGEVLAQLAAGRVRIEEVEKGLPGETGEETDPNATKFGRWQVPGGENYRELLLTLPEKQVPLKDIDTSNWTVETIEENEYTGQRDIVIFDENGNRLSTRYGFRGTDEMAIGQMAETEKDEAQRAAQKEVTYKSTHWDEPNVLAHVRFNERTGPDGERILFIEEIQSDWHQVGRKKGYATGKGVKVWNVIDEVGEIAASLDSREGAQEYAREYGYRIDQIQEGIGEPDATLAGRSISLVPDAPYKKTWPLLAMKRMVRYAAEAGFDAIAWTPGEVQAGRYDLSKQIDALSWDSHKNDTGLMFEGLKGVSDQTLEIQVKRDTGLVNTIDVGAPQEWVDKHLSDIIGKDLAEQVLAEPKGRIEQEGLKVGGEGMRGFYDKILPAAVNKFFGKKAWGKTKTTPISFKGKPQGLEVVRLEPMGGYPVELADEDIDFINELGDAQGPTWAVMDEDGSVVNEFFSEEEAEDYVREHGGRMAFDAWHLPITPEMRQKALGEGMTLFQMADTTDVFGEVLPSEVAEKMEAARGRDKASVKQRVGDWIKTAIATFTPGQMYPQMPNKYFGKENEILRRFVEIASYSKSRAVMDLKEILNPKKLGPAGYDLFNLKIVLDDMLYDVETEGRPLYNWQERYGELPFGFENADQLRESLARIDQRVAANADVAEGLQKRRKIMRELRRDLVAEGLLDRSVLDDERYFHHEVLQYANLAHMAGVGTGSRDVRTKKKGWQIYRTGSIKDYNTEYMQSEFKVLAQGYSQLETKRILDELDASSNIIGELRQKARQLNYVAIVGGQENYNRLQQLRNQVAYLRGDGRGLDSDTKAQIKALTDEIWQLDPTMPFRQKIAIGMSKIGEPLEDDLEYMDFSEIARLADAGDMGAATVLKAVSERKAFIAEALGDAHMTWQKLMEEREPRKGSAGWAEWIPKPGSAWYLTNSLTDKLLEQVAAGVPISPEEIRQVWTRGTDKRWVVPVELAEVLNGKEFMNLKLDNVIAAAAEMSLNWWKRWILINPFRIFKYNFNNLSGDFDIVLAYDPKILKWARQAAKDLWAWHYDKAMSPALKAEVTLALKHGVIGSGMTVHDIPDITDSAQFDQLVSALRADKRKSIDHIKRFWQGSKNFTTWRENVLRLAAYRYFQSQVRAGKRVYGASDQAKVDATTNPDKKAALLARELIGDYGGLSKGGQWLRRQAIPFYSWMEINAPRYWRMFKNLPVEGESKGRRLRMGGALAKKAGVTTAKMALFYTMVQAFNHLVWPDEEEELGEVGRRQLHLILGRRSDGSIISVRMQGALSDALLWVGAEDIPQDLADVRSGKKRWWQLIAEAPVSAVNRLVQGIRPDIKGPAEIATGRQLFPDVTKPRPIRDRYEHVARMFSLEPIYRHLAGRPLRGDDFAERIFEDLAATITATHDPGQVAFHQTKSLVIDYLKNRNIERPMVDPTNRANALFYYRKAIQLGDTEAAVRYLKKYLKLGGSTSGIRTSIKRQHPLAGLPARYRLHFMRQLTPADRQSVKRAIAWYRKTYR
jgi:N12 class adenine-specific DNA methylase